MRLPHPKWDPLIFAIIFAILMLSLTYFAIKSVNSSEKENKAMREKLEKVLIKWECGPSRLDELLIVKKDYGGKLVVGIGHDILPNEYLKLGDRISVSEMSRHFTVDVNAAIDSASQIIKYYDQHPEDVMVVVAAMCFQLGREGTHKFKKMIAAINDRNYGLAADEMLDSKWVKETPRRAHAMADLMRSADKT